MTSEEELESLQKRLNKLKGKKAEPEILGLSKQFEGAGETFNQVRKNIPHIKVGSEKARNYTDDPFVVKMKKWLLIGLTFLVGGIALIMIISKIIGRFL